MSFSDDWNHSGPSPQDAAAARREALRRGFLEMERAVDDLPGAAAMLVLAFDGVEARAQAAALGAVAESLEESMGADRVAWTVIELVPGAIPPDLSLGGANPGPCLGCGCTDDRACPGGCSWVSPHWCSACAARSQAPALVLPGGA